LVWEAAEKNEVERTNKGFVPWTNKEDLKELPFKDIIENGHFDQRQPGKPVDGLILPKKFDKVPFIQANGSKSSNPPEKKQPHDSKNYKSPLRKLLVFFERSRNKWKTKCLNTKEELKLASIITKI
jgi:hypothetical protein